MFSQKCFLNLTSRVIIRVCNCISKFSAIFFIFLHIILSLDFGYVNYRSERIECFIKVLTLLYSLSVSSFTSLILFIKFNDLGLNHFWTISGSVQFFLNSLILIKFRQQSFCVLKNTLISIDTQLAIDSKSYQIDVKIILGCLSSVLFKILLTTIFCINVSDECTESYIGVILLNMESLSFDFTMVISSFIFYSVYCRIMTLNSLVRSNDRDADYCLTIYKSISIAQKSAKKSLDYLYVIAMLVVIPGLILQVYLGLERLKEEDDADSVTYLILRSLAAIQNFMVLSYPAVSAGLVTSAVEKLKLLLLDKLLRERDTEHEPHLQMFLDYVNGRPMQFTVFKVVHLDWSLPVLILNLCISYQIIIVQFTKLY